MKTTEQLQEEIHQTLPAVTLQDNGIYRGRIDVVFDGTILTTLRREEVTVPLVDKMVAVYALGFVNGYQHHRRSQ